MARYRDEDIDALRERADIVEVISEHVRLRKAGRAMKGLCPFHDERTPSFTVDRDLGIYHCYGCGESGNVFQFVMKHDNLTFPEVVDVLARRLGMEMKLEGGPQAERRESSRSRLLALHVEAVDLFQQQLASRDGEPVRQYLESRGITTEVQQRYKIGFGGWRRDGLVRALAVKGASQDDVVESGIGSRSDGRAMRDTFAGRVLFPIFDPGDRPIGFGGRVIPEEFRRAGAVDNPKYLNTRATEIFDKSKVLYGMNWARGEVFQKRRLVIVEGYTDVVAMREAGIGETVATCGTAITQQHMKEISTRFGDVRVVLCLDSDSAGQGAMSRESTRDAARSFAPGEETRGGWLPVGKGWLPEVYVAVLPEGQDPADFARGGGDVEKLLGSSVSLVEFLLRRVLDGKPTDTPENRARAVRDAAEVLAEVGDSLLRHEYALSVADRTGVDAYEVLRVVESRASGRKAERRPKDQGKPVVVAPTGHVRVEREALHALICVPKLLAEPPEETQFTMPMHRAVLRLLLAEYAETRTIDPSRLAQRVADEQLRRSVTELSVGVPVDMEIGRETLLRLSAFAFERRIGELQVQLRTLDPERESAAYDAIFEELARLQKELRGIRDHLKG